MRITLAPLISSARGRLGNVVFSIAASGQPYVRQVAAIASNPRSTQQQNIRNMLVWLAHEWHDTLDAAAKAQWEEFAQKTRGIRVDEDQGGGKYNLIPHSRGYMSGFNAYIGINQRLLRCGVDPGDYTNTPPTGPAPYNALDIAAVWNVVDADIDVTWTEGDLSTDFVEPALRMWLESYEAGAHKQLIVCADTQFEAETIDQVRYALGILGDIGVHPGLYRLQFDIIENDPTASSRGLISPPSEIFEVIAL